MFYYPSLVAQKTSSEPARSKYTVTHRCTQVSSLIMKSDAIGIPPPKEISSLTSNAGEIEARQEMIDELDKQHALFALEAPAHAAALWTIGQIEAFYESEGKLLGPGLQVARHINPLYHFSIDQSVALHCTFSLQRSCINHTAPIIPC